MIKGFVYDMDGVLTETATLHYEAWRDVVKPYGINYTAEENMTLKGLPRLDTLKAILKMHKRLDDFTPEQLDEMARIKNDDYLAKLDSDLSEKNILPGIIEFLKEAKKRGIKQSISSSSRNAPHILEKLNMTQYFDYVADPTQIKHGKPAPDLYLLATKGINLDPSEVVGFEDAMPGVEGLLKAKIKTVAITWGDDGDWDKATMVINSTADLDIDKILAL